MTFISSKTGYRLQYYKEGAQTPTKEVKLVGTIAPRGFFIICQDKAAFLTIYGKACNQEAAFKLGNGDDQYGKATPLSSRTRWQSFPHVPLVCKWPLVIHAP